MFMLYMVNMLLFLVLGICVGVIVLSMFRCVGFILSSCDWVIGGWLIVDVMNMVLLVGLYVF